MTLLYNCHKPQSWCIAQLLIIFLFTFDNLVSISIRTCSCYTQQLWSNILLVSKFCHIRRCLCALFCQQPLPLQGGWKCRWRLKRPIKLPFEKNEWKGLILSGAGRHFPKTPIWQELAQTHIRWSSVLQVTSRAYLK